MSTGTRSVAFHTLGCKLNYSETSTLSRMMQKEGFESREFSEQADVYVINTCSVTDNADKECRQLVRRIQRKSPSSVVVVTGCYAQLKPQEIASIPGVHLVLGAAEKFNLPFHLKNLSLNDSAKICTCDISEVHDFNPSFSLNDRTRTFLKVQDGCDYNCSFCTIPMARGRSRSNTISNVLQQTESIAKRGVREVVLTGVNLGDFGKRSDDLPEEDFLELLVALEQQGEIERIRISSIEPNLLSDNIIELVASSKYIMPHFHIPLQSGSNRILGLMRRRYRRELYAEKIVKIKSLMPHCAIGVDVIVGFPGETDEDFRDTFEFLHSLDVSYLHVFTYSERPNTKALEILPVVKVEQRNQRNQLLRALSLKKMNHFSAQHAGQRRKVLFEAADRDGMMEGFTDNYIKVVAPYKQEWVNEIVDWNI
jgi:threonylcarbamoyladenosine tRNA methylthiotransferase MtaB